MYVVVRYTPAIIIYSTESCDCTRRVHLSNADTVQLEAI
jgi:hypothetical protein